jgi:hypothetical protein
MGTLFFYLGLAFILTHEMDAIRMREWELFPGFGLLSEENAYRLFTLLHVPLYLWLFWLLFLSPGQPLNLAVVVVLDWFFIVHFLLHILFIPHPHYRFKNWFSWLLIGGCGLCGALDLLYVVR